MLGEIKISTFTKRNLNYWTYSFTYDKNWFETLGECDYGYNSFIECYRAIKEDKKENEMFMKTQGEPRCYYHAMYYEWCEEDNCYYYTEYEIYTRKLKNGNRKIYAKVVD